MASRIELDVPDEFVMLSKRFGLATESLAALLVADICMENPSNLWIVSSVPIEYAPLPATPSLGIQDLPL